MAPMDTTSIDEAVHFAAQAVDQVDLQAGKIDAEPGLETNARPPDRLDVDGLQCPQ